MENDDFTTERPKDVYVEHVRPGLDYIYDTKGGELLWIVNYEMPEDIWNDEIDVMKPMDKEHNNNK